MKQSPADPVIDEIHEVRHRISARVDHEPARLVAYYIELQKRYHDRFVAAVRVAEPVDGQPPNLAFQTDAADESESALLRNNRCFLP